MRMCLLALCICMNVSYATQVPIKLSVDQRISVVPYDENNVVPIDGSTFTATQIIFSKKDVIQNIQTGDLGAWTASVDKNLPYMIFLKPTAYDSHTNMTVVTSRHTYYFDLQSHKQGEAVLHPTFALRFVYPHEEQAKVLKEVLERESQQQAELSAFAHPGDYNWDYTFNGDTRLVPLHVFDDGQFTYFQLQPDQTIPAVFAIDSADGKESVVNVRVDKGYLIVQRIAPQFTLRSGEAQVASLFNNKEIKKMGLHHE